MRRVLQLALVLLAINGGFAQVVDRMVAVVNKRVILESELDQALRVEYLMQGKSLDKISPRDSSAVLDRLVHSAHRLELKGESLRKLRAAKNATLDEATAN